MVNRYHIQATLMAVLLSGAIFFGIGDNNSHQITHAAVSTFYVNTPDADDDGSCDTPYVDAGTDCTIYEAIDAANNNGNPTEMDTIVFDMTDYPGYGPAVVYTLSPSALALPAITERVTIDATATDGVPAGCSGWTPLIELDGAAAGAGVIGLDITGGNSTVRGLSITGYTDHAVLISSGGYNTLECNYFGLNTDGDTVDENGTDVAGTFDVEINASTNNTIGGADWSDGNKFNRQYSLSLSNGDSNTIQNNEAGYESDGETLLAASGETHTFVIKDGSANNFIYDNHLSAQLITTGAGTDSNTYKRNILGLSRDGTSGSIDVPNGNKYCTVGMTFVSGAADNTVGGPNGVSDRNIIACGTGANGPIHVNGTGLTIEGNYLGTDINGSTDFDGSRTGYGIYFLSSGSDDTTIRGNVIGGYQFGVILNENGTNVEIIDNHIGTNETGVASIPNDSGIKMQASGGSYMGIEITGNQIANNITSGIDIFSMNHLGIYSKGILISQNLVYSNTLNIELASFALDPGPVWVNQGLDVNDDLDADVGSNDHQNYPLVSEAVVISSQTQRDALGAAFNVNTLVHGSFNSLASTSFHLEFFENTTNTPGSTKYLGSDTVMTDVDGDASFVTQLTGVSTAGNYITATAINNSTFDSSEYSPAALIVEDTTPPNGAITFSESLLTSQLMGQEVTITFDESMHTSNPDLDIGFNGFTSTGDGTWLSDTVFQETFYYTEDAGGTGSDITAYVSGGAFDLWGNAAVVTSDTFDLDILRVNNEGGGSGGSGGGEGETTETSCEDCEPEHTDEEDPCPDCKSAATPIVTPCSDGKCLPPNPEKLCKNAPVPVKDLVDGFVLFTPALSNKNLSGAYSLKIKTQTGEVLASDYLECGDKPTPPIVEPCEDCDPNPPCTEDCLDKPDEEDICEDEECIEAIKPDAPICNTEEKTIHHTYEVNRNLQFNPEYVDCDPASKPRICPAVEEANMAISATNKELNLSFNENNVAYVQGGFYTLIPGDDANCIPSQLVFTPNAECTGDNCDPNPEQCDVEELQSITDEINQLDGYDDGQGFITVIPGNLEQCEPPTTMYTSRDSGGGGCTGPECDPNPSVNPIPDNSLSPLHGSADNDLEDIDPIIQLLKDNLYIIVPDGSNRFAFTNATIEEDVKNNVIRVNFEDSNGEIDWDYNDVVLIWDRSTSEIYVESVNADWHHQLWYQQGKGENTLLWSDTHEAVRTLKSTDL